LSTPDDGSDLPKVASAVSVRVLLPDGSTPDLVSQLTDIEEVDGTSLFVVARPDLSRLPEPGAFLLDEHELTMTWPHGKGRLEMPVTGEAATRPYGSVWLLKSAGAARFNQRRQYFRTDVHLPATLTWKVPGPDAEETTLAVILADLSEGGAAVSCEDELPEVGTRVTLLFSMDDMTLTADAEVLRHRVLPIDRPTAALGFVDAAAYGDEIRRFTYAVQRRQARNRLD
jgi:hypothetical protein